MDDERPEGDFARGERTTPQGEPRDFAEGEEREGERPTRDFGEGVEREGPGAPRDFGEGLEDSRLEDDPPDEDAPVPDA